MGWKPTGGWCGRLKQLGSLDPELDRFIVGDGTDWVTKAPSDARTALGLGSLATQNAAAVQVTGGSIVDITDLAVADGGTGASNAAAARTNLGLGSIATQSAASVTITGGNISNITDLAIADGGTGAGTAAGARTNLGLGTIATQSAGAVAITGGSIINITDLGVGDGGTGASDASGARTNLGLGIGTQVQAYDADLTALAGVSTVGLLARTGAGTAAARAVAGTAGELAVSNGDGVAGNPTISLVSGLILIHEETLGSDGYFERTAIPQNFRTLTIEVVGRSSGAGTQLEEVAIQFGPTAALDTGASSYGYRSTDNVSSTASFAASHLLLGRAALPRDGHTAGATGFIQIVLPNYAYGSEWAVVRAESSTPHETQTEVRWGHSAGVWKNASDPVQRLKVFCTTNAIKAGSRIRIWGQK